MASRLDSGDRTAMARDMNTVPDFIRDQDAGSFACFMRGVTQSAISLRFPQHALARFGSMTTEERDLVRNRNRATYATRISEDPPDQPDSSDQPEKGGRRPRRDPDAP